MRTDHKEGKASIKVVYYTHKTLKNGHHPFMLRVIKDRKVKYISTGLSLHPKFWNENRNEIRRNFPDRERDELIDALDSWQKRYELAAGVLASTDQPHGPDTVLTAVAEGRAGRNERKAAGSGLIAYGERIEERLRAGGQVGNADAYWSALNRLKAFLATRPGKPEDIPFSEVTVRFCNDWEAWMRSEGVGDNTLHNRFRMLRAIVNRAIAEEESDVAHYPFARTVAERHKFVVSKFDTSTRKRAISRDDVALIEGFVPTGSHSGVLPQGIGVRVSSWSRKKPDNLLIVRLFSSIFKSIATPSHRSVFVR